ncbi:hypothetical protein RRG08_017095 [Elysia crispata]|uniref:Uncharacterized protein n=1 Tax=Elysia crispata TaxID=231223 RepID=A0AAE1DKB2_9GAST|nr:hypothetical protein RRG08_017095 [Elysia crispata]
MIVFFSSQPLHQNFRSYEESYTRDAREATEGRDWLSDFFRFRHHSVSLYLCLSGISAESTSSKGHCIAGWRTIAVLLFSFSHCLYFIFLCCDDLEAVSRIHNARMMVPSSACNDQRYV